MTRISNEIDENDVYKIDDKCKYSDGPWYFYKSTSRLHVSCRQGDVAIIYPTPEKNDLANANLISSAPELLYSLEYLLHEYKDVCKANNIAGTKLMVRFIEDIIKNAKAKGTL